MSKANGSALIEAMMLTLVLSISLASGLSMVQLTQQTILEIQHRQIALQQLQQAQSELLDRVNRDALIAWQPSHEAITVKQDWHSARQATFWLAHAKLQGEIPVYVELASADPVEY